MKVLFFLVGQKFGGAEKRALRYLNLSLASEHVITLLINQKLVDAAKLDEELTTILSSLIATGRVRVLSDPPIALLARFNLWFTFQLIGHLWLHRKHYSLVHSTMIHYPNLISVFFADHVTLCEVCGPQEVPMLLGQSHELGNTLALRKNRLSLPWLKRYFASRADAYLCVSRSVMLRLNKHFKQVGLGYKIDECYMPQVPLFIPCQSIYHTIKDVSKENLIVYASSFYGRKNPILFARVLARFLKDNSDWKAAVLGGGELESEVKEILIDAMKSGQIELIGRVASIYPYLVRSKVYVSLITPDNYPSQSVFEAMYCKNALLCTDVGDTGRMVGDENGILTNFEEEDVLRDLKRLIGDDHELIARGEASRERLLREFPSSLYVENIHAIYQKIAKEEK